MIDKVFGHHISRLRSSLAVHSSETLCDFITTHTYLNAKKFSFVGHEYQKVILEDRAQTRVIVKSAQMGISEMSAREAVSRCALLDGFSVIYTLPSASAAQNFMQTRINPVIDGSPYLGDLVSKAVDNTSIKRLSNSYLYLKGCQVDRQAISVPADMLITDEVNNSDQDVMTLYESRLIHSEYALRTFLSTPSVPNYGIDRMFKQSKRKFNMCKCKKCSQWFIPDYHDHVKIPGFDKPLESISRDLFADPKFHWMKAYVQCPKCKSAVNLITAKREWVVENTRDAFIDSGYQVSPFDCPTVITPSALVKSSVSYDRPVDFYNQRLGKSLEDKQTSLGKVELEEVTITEKPSGSMSYVLGLDMGNVCWAMITGVGVDQTLVIVHIEAIPLHKVVDRVCELNVKFRLRMIVADRSPSAEAIYQIQQRISNSFAAVFVMSKGIDLFRVVDRESDEDKGVQGMRQVNISKDAVMDVLMALVRSRNILKISDDMNETWYTHMTDNKRVQQFKGGELVYTWVKTLKVDHLHMSLIYAFVASRILGVSSHCGASLPLLSSFKVNQPPVR